ncbi:MAG: 30S ribosomal protein S3 [Nanoarchaeota archaeon]|nr:MAG: 30S ribosomal protein S3 [Nanoarchaeota archaeon]
MIEREFVKAKMKEFQIQEYISTSLKNVGHSHTKVQKTPLGEKIIIFTSRPGLIVGRKGQNITKLTKTLKKKFGLENPQIEISEVQEPNLDARIVAERIASSLEKFGSKRFKGVLHKAMEDTLASGALGVEILLSGKVPSARAKSWRIFGGYMKKCGDIAQSQVKKAQAMALLKSGIIGIKVMIMTSDVKMPDDISVDGEEKTVEYQETPVEKKAEEPKEEKKPKKRTRKKEGADGNPEEKRN